LLLLILHLIDGVRVDSDELALCDVAGVNERVELGSDHGLDIVCAVAEDDAPSLGGIGGGGGIVADCLDGEDLQDGLLEARDWGDVAFVDWAEAVWSQQVRHRRSEDKDLLSAHGERGR